MTRADNPCSGLLTEGDRSCSAWVFFDFVAQGERGAGVAGLGVVELGAERGEGAGAAGRGERVEPHVQGPVAGGMSPLVVRASRMRAQASSPARA